MARGVGKLSAITVTRTREPGRYADGGGLYLQVGPAGGKAWLFRYMLRGRAREMGLGPLDIVPLTDARAKAAECRRLRHAGIDPIDERQARIDAANLETARAISFKACAEAYIESHKAGWRNAVHAAQWTSTLATYAYPFIGSLPVQRVELDDVLKVLQPIWVTIPETAGRVRGRIESILDWAKVKGFRVGDNPARWRGHLNQLLPKKGKVRRIEHHAALPFDQVADFVADLRQQAGVSARALEFTICTAARTGETIGATWSEIDLEAKLWTVPGDRIKGGREHRVPLTARAIAIIEEMRPVRSATAGDFIFPGGKAGKPLSNMAMLEVLRRMGRGDLTTHGFRSTFRDWAAERTSFPSEVAEMALAHVVDDKVEAAYRRGDLFEKRRKMMEAWAKFCEPRAAGSNVAPFAARAGAA